MGSPGEDDLCQLPATTLSELASQFVECDGVTTLDLHKPFLDCGEPLGVGEYLGGLFERLVLVNGNEHGRGSAMSCHHDVFSEVGDSVDELSEVAPQLANRDGLSHTG